MSAFSALSVFKSLTKSVANKHGWQLADARERLSVSAGFSSFHELRTTAENHPEDVRLLRHVFGIDQFDSVVFLPNVLDHLEEQVARLALLDSLVQPSPNLTIHMSAPQVSSDYLQDTGVLFVQGKAELTGVEQFPLSQTFQWWDALLEFEVKFRDLRWELVVDSVNLRMSEMEHSKDEEDDDGFTDYPPTDFWD